MSTKIAFILFITSTALSFLTAIASSGPVSSPAPSPESYFSPSPTGESGSPTASPPGDDCLESLFSMYDCQSYVTAGSNLTQPEKACCPELSDVVNKNPTCLCKLFGNTTATIGITVDVSRATKLPSLCNVTTPDPSLCALLNGNPISLPPSSGPGAQPPTGVAGEGGLAGASPTAGNGKSGAIRRASCSTSASLVGLATVTMLSMLF